MYIKRDLENKIISLSSEYSCLLITGPRQVGKTTVLKRLMSEDRKYVSLEDLEERTLAKRDPAMFLQKHSSPVFIDEIQYAPELFSYIKTAADNGAAPGAFWITGSQAFHLMELAQETLAGRAAILHMSALSQHEIYGSGECFPFSPEPEELKKRSDTAVRTDIKGIYERIWKGAMPGLISGKYTDRDAFYSNYLQTYIDRDVSEFIERLDKLLFRDFIRAVACRVGQMLNIHDIAVEIGVSDETAKRWLRVLEKTDVIFYLYPYSNNLLKRTVKTPKMFFFDTGFAAFLAQYSSPDILMNGAVNGTFLENYIVMEIVKTYRNTAKDCLLWYYRDKSGNEIDMVIEMDGRLHPLEIKRSVDTGDAIAGAFRCLDKGPLPRGTGAVLCVSEKLTAIDSQNYLVPVWLI